MIEQQQRANIIRIAHEWVGTPFHDQQRVKGVGVDCAQIIAAIFEEAGLIPYVETGYYSPQFFLHETEERYLKTVLGYAAEIIEQEAKPADLVLFKIGRLFAHGAIIVEPGWPHIIHAYKLEGFVTVGLGDVGEIGRRQRRFFRYDGWIEATAPTIVSPGQCSKERSQDRC